MLRGSEARRVLLMGLGAIARIWEGSTSHWLAIPVNSTRTARNLEARTGVAKTTMRDRARASCERRPPTVSGQSPPSDDGLSASRGGVRGGGRGGALASRFLRWRCRGLYHGRRSRRRRGQSRRRRVRPPRIVTEVRWRGRSGLRSRWRVIRERGGINRSCHDGNSGRRPGLLTLLGRGGHGLERTRFNRRA